MVKPRGRRNKIGGQFSAKLIEMLESPAWRTLSLTARRLLDRVEIELAHHGGNDNGQLPVTYEDLLRYGIGDRDAIAAARREAVALGFLRFRPGRGGNREFRNPDLFGLTYYHADNPTHEWRKFETLEDAYATARQAREAKDPKAVEQGRRRAAGRRQEQKTGPGKSAVSVRQTRTEESRLPVRESRTTGPVGKPGRLSISGPGVTANTGQSSADTVGAPVDRASTAGGSRARPQSAVASEPPAASNT